MLAVVEISGKQFTTKVGDVLKIQKLEGQKGDKLKFEKILAYQDNDSSEVGAPYIKASVEAEIIEQIKDKKVIVFKKKRRHNYRRKQGHRQQLSVIKITSINK